MEEYQRNSIIMDIFLSEDSVEQKVKRVQNYMPNMPYYWSDWTAFFGYEVDQLPIIKGVEVTTKFKDKMQEYMRDYIVITQYPKQVLPEVQKTIMRLLGATGGFHYVMWGVGQMNDTIEKYLAEYKNAHPGVKFEPGRKYGYPKVYTFDYEIWDEAPNECYSIVEITGFLLD